MIGRIRSRLSSAHLTAVAALIFAAGGGSALALQGVNGVNSGDIRNGSIRSADVRNNTLRGADIRETTLNCNAIPGCGTNGPPGPGGPPGSPGGGSGGGSIPYGRFFSDAAQFVAPGQSVAFTDVGPTNETSLSSQTVVSVARAGIYSIDARVLAQSGLDSGKALAIEVNDVLTTARSGAAMSVAQAATIHLDSLLELPAGAAVRLVNIGSDPMSLTSSAGGATVNSAELDIHFVSSS